MTFFYSKGIGELAQKKIESSKHIGYLYISVFSDHEVVFTLTCHNDKCCEGILGDENHQKCTT